MLRLTVFKKWIRKLVVVVLLFALLPSNMIAGNVHAQNVIKQNSSTETLSIQEEPAQPVTGIEIQQQEVTYTNFLKNTQLKAFEGSPIDILLSEAVQENESTGSFGTYLESFAGYYMEYEDVVHILVDVPEAALYSISMSYICLNDNLLATQLSLDINGNRPYSSLSSLDYTSQWVAEETYTYDRYGNEIALVPTKQKELQTANLSDGGNRYEEALLIPLEKGSNTLSFTVIEGDILITELELQAKENYKPVSYEPATGSEIIVIEGENIASRNDSSIRATGEYDLDLQPYSSKKRVLNTLDGNSFKRSGQKITYDMTVTTPGYYHLAVDYKQSNRIDYPVFVDVELDHSMINEKTVAYPLPYTTSYQTHLFTGEDHKHMSVYLEEGQHELSFTLSVEPIVAQIERVERVMDEINTLALQINKLTGTKTDKYRDFDLDEYIPGIKDLLTGWAVELQDVYSQIAVYSTVEETIGAFSSLEIARKNLLDLADKPNELPSRMTEFSNGTTSVIQYLANTIQVIDSNQLAIDTILLYQTDAQLPESIGWFTKLIESIKRFFYSFMDQSYSVNQTNPEHLQVWINRSRQYVEILQKMIDEDFTPRTGISVDLSIMPDQNKLILANAAGKTPDVAQSIHFALPYDLAIRGALEDLSVYEGYDQVVSHYPEGLLIPGLIENSVYAIPETMNFWVLYYRSDILKTLNIPVPNTMKEVTEILPELQRRGMSFYYPSAGMPGIKYFAATMPLIYQYGGEFYKNDVGKTTINSEESIKGLQALTDLFLIYNAPFDVPSFYQHFRDGSLPIGIAEYGMYNLLLNAAPEIAGKWDVALFPGVEDEKGEVLRYTAGAAESSVIFKASERKDEAWEYLQWVNSVDVQVEFGYTLQTTYGKEFLWNTANLDAFNALPWKSSHREVIAEQAKWMVEAPRVPGSYMLERELSNLYNAVVVDGKKLRTSVDNAVKRIDRETMRKLEEFGYAKNGEMIKPYPVPSFVEEAVE
jgi:ABC-type glycerol-3-phosphate transport system substrate-binding protein